jgi:hypothetical protein
MAEKVNSPAPPNTSRPSLFSYLIYGVALSSIVYYSASVLLLERGGYAMCSATGVYTVDTAKPRVECISVSSNGIITGVGSLGKYFMDSEYSPRLTLSQPK